MFKKLAFVTAVLLLVAGLPISSSAHQKDDQPTISLDEFISRIQYNTKEQSWGLKGKDDFQHVKIEIRYNFGVLLRGGFEDADPIHLTILLDSPFHQSRPRSFKTTDGKTVKVDDFKIFFIPRNSRIPRNDLPAAIKNFGMFLKNHEPIVVITHATMWGTSRYLRQQNRFYYLNIHFEELNPEPNNPPTENKTDTK